MLAQLKEDPREWRKYTVQVAGVLTLLSAFLYWRGALNGIVSSGIGVLGLTLSLTALAFPRWFRGFYRAGMTSSAWLGERMGRIVLTLFFFLMVFPLGLVLRCVGHDPLSLKKRRDATSYWRPAAKPGSMERMY